MSKLELLMILKFISKNIGIENAEKYLVGVGVKPVGSCLVDGCVFTNRTRFYLYNSFKLTSCKC